MRDVADGIVTLKIAGSPGATIPLAAVIANLFRHYLPEVAEVRFDPALDGTGASGATPAERVQHILDEQVNPAVSAHRGSVSLVEVKDDTAFIRFEGGCQGCAMADVTLRQGVEVMIKRQVAEIVAVVDATDHAAGTDPYFKTKKGPA